MAGWCTSVRTITHAPLYTKRAHYLPPAREESRRATSEDALTAPACDFPTVGGIFGGPCGSAPRAEDAGKGSFAYLLDQINDYRQRWGHSPLGITRDTGARRMWGLK